MSKMKFALGKSKPKKAKMLTIQQLRAQNKDQKDTQSQQTDRMQEEPKDEVVQEPEAKEEAEEERPLKEAEPQQEDVTTTTTMRLPRTSIKGSQFLVKAFMTTCVLAGLDAFLKSPIGGGRDAKFVESLEKKVFELLLFVKIAIDGAGFIYKNGQQDAFSSEVWSVVTLIATEHLDKIGLYLEDLTMRKGTKDDTKKKLVHQIK
jgi:hypothetical protein